MSASDKYATIELTGEAKALALARLGTSRVTSTQARQLAEIQRAQQLLATQEAIRRAECAVAGLAADPAVQRWEQTARTELQTRLEAIRQSQNVDEADALVIAAAQLVARAEQAERHEVHRQVVCEKTCQALAALGFAVQGGYPQPHEPATPRSLTLILARRGTEDILIGVPHEKRELHFALPGHPRHDTVGVNGDTERTCPEAELELGRLQEELGRVGVRTGDLTWEGKPASRPPAGSAVARPNSAERTVP